LTECQSVEKEKANESEVSGLESCSFASSIHARPQDTAARTVRVVGARNKKGKIGVTLFQEAQGFPDDTSQAIRQQSVDINPSQYSERTDDLQGLPRGTFAVSLVHDENGNGKRDKNFMGIPK
jgi:uncharacterized protein (DUF2141 family)